jgi:hypothetical protein
VQTAGLRRLAVSRDRGEADWARAVFADAVGLDKPAHCGSVRRSRRYVAPVAQRLCARGPRSARDELGVGTGPGQGRSRRREWWRHCSKHPSATALTGRGRATSTRSRRARASPSPSPACPRSCEKKFRGCRPRHTLNGRVRWSNREYLCHENSSEELASCGPPPSFSSIMARPPGAGWLLRNLAEGGDGISQTSELGISQRGHMVFAGHCLFYSKFPCTMSWQPHIAQYYQAWEFRRLLTS